MSNAAPVLLYLHIPKAAGTTMSSLLYEQLRSREGNDLQNGLFHSGVLYHPADYVKAPELASEQPINAMLSRTDLTAVLGHFHFGLHERMTRAYQYATVLRDPISRILSLFHFQRLNEAKYGHLKGIRLADNVDVQQFVATPPYAEIDNGMTRRISGQWPPIGECSADMLQAAKSHLQNHFAIVGLAEHFDETLVLMSELLGWGDAPLYYPKNVNTQRPRAEPSSERVAAIIRRYNCFDVELYRFASDLFQQKLAALGPQFQDKLQRYRERKRCWYARHEII